MCGIAGFVGIGDRETLARMTAALAHRGPDDSGLWVERNVFLGHRRLSIVDLTGGHQPMSTQDGDLTVTFNGEIYNHAGLRAELKKQGHVFQTDRSDTEVLLHGYREWGSGLPKRLNGMWAFALYDRKAGKLRIGVNPAFGKVDHKPFCLFSGFESIGQRFNRVRLPLAIDLPSDFCARAPDFAALLKSGVRNDEPIVVE